jgi:hypothetical protein
MQPSIVLLLGSNLFTAGTGLGYYLEEIPKDGGDPINESLFWTFNMGIAF